MIRWGILGAGNIARRFAQSLRAQENAALYAISGRKWEKLDAFAAAFSVPRVYVDHEELLADADVDAVYLALPHGLHLEWAIRALKAGKPVLCEKPAALSGAEMRAIAQTAQETGLLFMEAMKPRFVPLFSEWLRRLPEIGELTRVETSFCNEMPFDPAHPTYHTEPGQGGALLDGGIYCASWLQLLFGCPSGVKLAAAKLEGTVDYYLDAELTFPGGQSARLECAFDRAKPKQAILHGAAGRMVVEDLHRPQRFCIYKEGKDPEEVFRPYVVDDFYGEIDHFQRCLETGKTESEIMPLSASIECADILDRIKCAEE